MHTISLVDPATFDPRRIAPIRHDFQSHPLLQLDALKDLARRVMPLQKCRFIKGGMRVDSPFEHKPVPQDGRGLEEVLATIEQPGSWLAIYDAQVDPIYRTLLAEVERHIRRIVAPKQRVVDVRSFLFLSAPPSVTPFHIDRENNFWLQIRGRKVLTLWDHSDRSIVPAEVVERFITTGRLDDVCLREGMLDRGRRFDCGPGDGAYFPSTTPHMTESRPEWNGGDTLSISVGMVFYTNVTRRHARALAFNQRLRRLGLRPKDPGGSDVRDIVKAYGNGSLRILQRLFGKRG